MGSHLRAYVCFQKDLAEKETASLNVQKGWDWIRKRGWGKLSNRTHLLLSIQRMQRGQPLRAPASRTPNTMHPTLKLEPNYLFFPQLYWSGISSGKGINSLAHPLVDAVCGCPQIHAELRLLTPRMDLSPVRPTAKMNHQCRQ